MRALICLYWIEVTLCPWATRRRTTDLLCFSVTLLVWEVWEGAAEREEEEEGSSVLLPQKWWCWERSLSQPHHNCNVGFCPKFTDILCYVNIWKISRSLWVRPCHSCAKSDFCRWGPWGWLAEEEVMVATSEEKLFLGCWRLSCGGTWVGTAWSCPWGCLTFQPRSGVLGSIPDFGPGGLHRQNRWLEGSLWLAAWPKGRATPALALPWAPSSTWRVLCNNKLKVPGCRQASAMEGCSCPRPVLHKMPEAGISPC